MILFMLIGLCAVWVAFLGCGGYVVKQLYTGEWREDINIFIAAVVVMVLAVLAIIVAAW